MNRTINFSLQEDDFLIKFESQAVTTDEVLAHFVQFMLGCGYAEESIYSGMRESIEEHEFFQTIPDRMAQAEATDLS